MSILHASERLRDDFNTVLLAVQQVYDAALSCMQPRMNAGYNVIQDGNALGCVGRTMRQNKQVVLKAIEEVTTITTIIIIIIIVVGAPS